MNDLLREAIQRRRKRLKAKSGLESEDLKSKRMVIMGEGVDDDILEKASSTEGSSTDDLSPSKQEMKARNVDTGSKEDISFDDIDDDYEDESEEEMAEKNDLEVYDQRAANEGRKKKKPTIYERMQMQLANKLKM